MSDRADERVVVTGLGVIAPNGCGLADFDAALREGRSGLRHQDVMEEHKFGCTVAGTPVLFRLKSMIR